MSYRNPMTIALADVKCLMQSIVADYPNDQTLTLRFNHLSNLLTNVQSDVNRLVERDELKGFCLAGVQDSAIELLLSLDESQADHAPRSNTDNIALVLDLLNAVRESQDDQAMAMEAANDE